MRTTTLGSGGPQVGVIGLVLQPHLGVTVGVDARWSDCVPMG